MNTNLLKEIIKKYERSSDWCGKRVGTRSLSFEKKTLYDKYGQRELVEEAIYWENLGVIRIEWLHYHYDLERIFYSLSDIPRIYALTGLISKNEKLEKAVEYVKEQLKHVQRNWIKEYYESLLEQLEKGNWPEEFDRCGTGEKYEDGHLRVGDEGYENRLFLCLNLMDTLRNPVYKTIFSNHCFGDSKWFKNKLETRVLTIARKYCPDIDEGMNDTQVLAQLYIEEYAQELSVKGDLIIEQDGEGIDLSKFRYGTVINSEMLKHVVVSSKQRIKKIITVENKANYMSMPYEANTLIVFSHGYFSPKEREFLKALEQVLSKDEVEYYHTGDLDYGGICIFNYIKNQIFPQIKPMMMDVDQFEKYKKLAIEMESSSWEKLKKLRVPEMQKLIDHILQEKKVIEQESFLMMRSVYE